MRDERANARIITSLLQFGLCIMEKKVHRIQVDLLRHLAEYQDLEHGPEELESLSLHDLCGLVHRNLEACLNISFPLLGLELRSVLFRLCFSASQIWVSKFQS